LHKPAYPLTIAIIGTASRRMIVAMAKTMKYAGYARAGSGW
jgi:maltoporin